MKEGKLLIFSAPSGAGKTSIVRYLLNKNKNLGFSVSATTRPMRSGEVDGRDYYFLSHSDFKQKIKEDAFAEYEQVYSGTLYGTLRAELERIWSQGKVAVFDVDVKGGIKLKKIFRDNALALFISVDSVEVLEQRLRSRNTETEESLMKRVGKAAYEMEYASQFDATILNMDFDQAVKDANKVIDDFIAKPSC